MKDDGTLLPLSEVQTQLGSILADVFFDVCPHETKKLLGLTPYLEGPKSEVWISPSDQLLGKVLLTPPLTDKCIKACTHEGILDLGQNVLKRFEQEIKDKERSKFHADLMEIQNMWEAEKRRMLELLSNSIHKEYEIFIGEIQAENKKKMDSALAEASRIHDRELRKAVATEKAAVTRNMLKKMRSEIGVAVESIYEEFEEQYRRQKEIIISDFNHILRMEKVKAEKVLQASKSENKEKMRLQRKELEMQNIADGTFILCLERLRCSSEKRAMHQSFENKLEAFQNLLLQANTANKEIVQEMSQANKRAGKLHWENKLRDVIREFQKYINFTFGAVPSQAEFLLNSEEIVKLEDDTDVNHSSEEVDEKRIEVVEIIDKHGQKWKPVKNLQPCQLDGLKISAQKSGKCIQYENENENSSSSQNDSMKCLTSYQSLPRCDCGKILFTRAEAVESDSDCLKKSMTQLAEGARFVVEFKSTKRDKDNMSTIKSPTCVQSDSNVSSKSNKEEKTCQVLGQQSSAHLQTTHEFMCRQMQIRKKLLKTYPSLQNLLLSLKNETEH